MIIRNSSGKHQLTCFTVWSGKLIGTSTWCTETLIAAVCWLAHPAILTWATDTRRICTTIQNHSDHHLIDTGLHIHYIPFTFVIHVMLYVYYIYISNIYICVCSQFGLLNVFRCLTTFSDCGPYPIYNLACYLHLQSRYEHINLTLLKHQCRIFEGIAGLSFKTLSICRNIVKYTCICTCY